MLHAATPLPEDLETLVHDVIGCCIAVHRAFGPGLLEGICSRAICLELGIAQIPFEREKAVTVMYRGAPLCEQRLDFVVGERLILEVKAIERLTEVHHAQILSYMRVAGIRVGLLMNFNVAVLRDGIKRKIL